jgi:hypothetical protein
MTDNAIVVSGLDVAGWQAILDRYRDLFGEADANMRMALVARHRVGADGVPRSVVQRICEPVPMLAWRHDGQGIEVASSVFRGLDTLAADLLFVGNEGAFEAVLAHSGDHPLGEMKRRIASGAIQLFVLRSRNDLRELGYEDFLEALGLPFLGACR